MPNHVTNQLTITADNLDEILKSIAGEEAIDFESIIPMPDGLYFEPAEHIIEYAKYVFNPMADNRSKWYFDLSSQRGQALSNFDDADWQMFLRCLINLHETGYATWHDWSIEHWGTKWNCYRVEQASPDVIRFKTAWSAPKPVIEKLSKLHPGATFRLEYADENMGYNLGAYVFRAGEIVEENHPVFGTDAAWVQAYKLRYPDLTDDEIQSDLAEWYEDDPDRAKCLTALILEK